MRIFLVGFMGSGKSHTGKLLAHLLNFNFQDLDQHIEQLSGNTIPDIFQRFGESEFRIRECKALDDLILQDQQNLIVSSGGGTPCFFDNMERMNEAGVTFFLDAPAKLLCERLLPGRNARPLLKDKSPEELEFFIQEKLNNRYPFYQKAMVTVHQSTFDFNVAALIHQHFYQIVGH